MDGKSAKEGKSDELVGTSEVLSDGSLIWCLNCHFMREYGSRSLRVSLFSHRFFSSLSEYGQTDKKDRKRNAINN